MSSEHEPTSPTVQAFWDRHEAFAALRDGETPTAQPPEIDVEGLMGTKGAKLSPTIVDYQLNHPEPDFTITPNHRLTVNSDRRAFPLYNDQDNWYTAAVQEEGQAELLAVTAGILGRLAARKTVADRALPAPMGAVEPLQQAIDELREPLRTVAINRLYYGVAPDEAARCFGTSVETIEFLTEVALDQVALRLVLVAPARPD